MVHIHRFPSVLCADTGVADAEHIIFCLIRSRIISGWVSFPRSLLLRCGRRAIFPIHRLCSETDQECQIAAVMEKSIVVRLFVSDPILEVRQFTVCLIPFEILSPWQLMQHSIMFCSESAVPTPSIQIWDFPAPPKLVCGRPRLPSGISGFCPACFSMYITFYLQHFAGFFDYFSGRFHVFFVSISQTPSASPCITNISLVQPDCMVAELFTVCHQIWETKRSIVPFSNI